jgi:hypothetical protein
MIRAAPPSADDPYESLPGTSAWFNAGNRAAGTEFTEVALEWLEAAGATVEQRGGRVAGIQIGAIERGGDAQRYIALAHGTLGSGPQAGLRRSDTVKKAGYDAVMLRRADALPVLVVTSHLPAGGASAAHLARLSADVVDVVATNGDLSGFQRVRALFGGVAAARLKTPAPPWHTPPGTDDRRRPCRESGRCRGGHGGPVRKGGGRRQALRPGPPRDADAVREAEAAKDAGMTPDAMRTGSGHLEVRAWSLDGWPSRLLDAVAVVTNDR